MNNDWRGLYPFASHELILNGFKLHYLDEGPENGAKDAPVLLMLHGNPTWSFYWRNLVSALRKTCRVVVPDHMGCGLSDRPASSEYSYTLDQRICDISTLIKTLDLREITLLAHDWGGAIGMGTAVRNAERFQRFVLFNTGAFHFPKIPLRIAVCRIPVFGRIAIQGFNAFARAAVTMAVEKKLPKDVKAGLLAPYNSWKNRLATYEFVRDIPMRPRERSWETLLEVENGLTQFQNHPIALIWGMRDWCFAPEFMNCFQKFFPNAETHTFSDAGHYVVEDAWERILPILDHFLQE